MTDQITSTQVADIKTSVSFPETLHDVFWRVEFMNGHYAYRNDVGETDSWLILKEYLRTKRKMVNSFNIVAMHFFFRDHWEEIGRDKQGWFFTKMIKGEYGGSTQFFFCGGYLNDDGKSVHIKKYVLPELLIMEEEDRNINDPTLERGLIFNRVKNQS